MRRVADLKPGDVVTAEPPWTFRAVASVDGPWTWVFTDTGPRRIPSGAILWLDGATDDHRRPPAPPPAPHAARTAPEAPPASEALPARLQPVRPPRRVVGQLPPRLDPHDPPHRRRRPQLPREEHGDPVA